MNYDTNIVKKNLFFCVFGFIYRWSLTSDVIDAAAFLCRINTVCPRLVNFKVEGLILGTDHSRRWGCPPVVRVQPGLQLLSTFMTWTTSSCT